MNDQKIVKIAQTQKPNSRMANGQSAKEMEGLIYIWIPGKLIEL